MVKNVKIMVCVMLLLMFLIPGTVLASDTIQVNMGVERVNASTLQLTAESTGGTDVEYRFDMRVMDSGDDYTTIREYAANPNFTWTGAADGVIYELVVHADADDASYNTYYVVFGNTLDHSPFTGLQTEVTAEGNQFRITATPQGGTNIIYALQYREEGGQYNSLDPANPYQASPVFDKTLGHGSYEFVVHAIDVASGTMEYQGSYSSFTQTAFNSLNATVDGLSFYESDDFDTIPFDQRVYKNTFDKNSTRFVYFNLALDYPAPGRQVDFPLRAVYSFSDGVTLGDFVSDYSVEPDWFYSSHSSGYGWHEPGNWPTGSYTVQIFDGNNEIARGQFTIE